MIASETQTAGPETWEFTKFLRPNGKAIGKVEDVIECLVGPASQGGSFLYGITCSTDDTVICHTGNGPNSEKNAALIASLATENENLKKVMNQIANGCRFPKDEVQRAILRVATEALGDAYIAFPVKMP